MADKEIKISVVIPVYNGSDNILECLRCLENQDIKDNYEIIVVDDASTDNSAEIVESFISGSAKSEQIRLIKCTENGRAGRARNIGVSCSSGEYVLFVDQDDNPDARMLGKLLQYTECGKHDMVSCALIDKDGSVLKRPNVVGSDELTDELRSRIMSSYGYSFATLFRRNMLVDSGLVFSENVLFEDTIYYGGAICLAKSINNTEEILYYRKVDDNSQTASFSKKKLNDRIDSTLQYLNLYKNIPQTRNCIKAIELMAFYYMYLSVVEWLMCMPKLYDKQTFVRALSEGKKLNVCWKDVYRTEKRFSKLNLLALEIIYYAPWTSLAFRGLGNLCYFFVHNIKRFSMRKKNESDS